MTSGIEPLEVEPIAGILQEVNIRVSKEIFSLSETSMDDIRSIPHEFELPFSSLITGLVINEDEVPFTKVAWVDVGVIMGLQLDLSCFDHLDSSMTILISLLKHK